MRSSRIIIQFVAFLLVAGFGFPISSARAASSTVTVGDTFTSNDSTDSYRAPSGALSRTKTYKNGVLKKDRLTVFAETTLANLHMTADEAKHATVDAYFSDTSVDSNGAPDGNIVGTCRFKVSKVNKKKGTVRFTLDVSRSKGKVSNKAGYCDVDWQTERIEKGVPFFGTIFTSMIMSINDEYLGSIVLYGQDYSSVYPD